MVQVGDYKYVSTTAIVNHSFGLFLSLVHPSLPSLVCLFPAFSEALEINIAVMKSSVLLTLAAGLCASAFSLERRQAANWTVGQTVQTESGPVNGHAAKNNSQVSEYLGIPYGQAPVGDLRFAAPVKFTGNSSINGTSFVSLTRRGIEITANKCVGSQLPSQEIYQ